MMTFRVKMTVLPALLLLLAMPQGTAHASRSLDVYLQCDGETRSRLLAFSAGNHETEDQRQADRRLRIEIRNSKRVSVVDLPSGEVLFGPSQCRISTMKLACEAADNNHHRQMFISRTSGDAMFEGYTETSDEKSALVVERYSCSRKTANRSSEAYSANRPHREFSRTADAD